MIFDFNFPVVTIVLFAVSALALVYIGFVYCRRLYLIRRHRRLCQEQAQEAPTGDFPKASIIIYTRTEPEALLRNLPMMLEQDYPAPFEVIVVNEGASTDTSIAVGQLKTKYPNLYLTFTPDGARNLSRKKLALTLGIKAAKGDVVVISDATSRVTSKNWLASLLRPFTNPDIEVVLGYGTLDYPAKRQLGRLVRAFDMVADNVAWMTSAILNKPYRGCGYNLAYRRQLFFDNKGFSRSLNLRDGDDDIFINEIVNSSNCAVQLSDDAIASKEVYAYKRQTNDDRCTHAFTGRNLPKGSRRLMAFGEWLMWVVLGCSGFGAWFALNNGIAWIIAALLIIGMFALVGLSWSRTMRSLNAPSSGVCLPLLAPLRPLRNARLSMRSRLSKSSFYTWTNPRKQ